MAHKKLNTYWLLLLALLLLAGMVLSVGETQARYTDDMLLLNTVAEPVKAVVTSDCLSDAPLTVLLGRYDPANGPVVFTMNTDAGVSGRLTWTVDQADYLGVELSIDGTPLDQRADITLTPGETRVSMTLLPTALAATLEADMDVHITVTWAGTLTGKFRVTLPAAADMPAAETDPQEEIPTDPEGGNNADPVEETPVDPEEEIPTDPEEEIPTDPEGENNTDPVEETTTDPETEAPAAEEETAVEAKAVISGEKILLGRSMNAGEFTFLLYRTESDYQIITGAEPVGTAVNDEAGLFSFAEQVYTEPGDYYYVVTEDASAGLGGITYDAKTVMVHVTVTRNEETLAAELTVGDGEAIEFVNRYTPAETTFTISGTKRFSGNVLKEGMFTFQLYAADEAFNPLGDPISTVSNNADGSFSFAEMTYVWAETHRYVAVEASPDDQGQITYDTRRYGITVTVTDDGLGQLKAAGVLTLVDGESVSETDAVVFTNIYHPAEGEAPLIRMDTLSRFVPDGLLPVKVSWIEGVEQIRLGMDTGETTAQPFPAFTRYSLDQGAGYEMLYYGGLICLDGTAGTSAVVLLDLSHAQLPTTVDLIESTNEEEPAVTVERPAELALLADACTGDWLISQTVATTKPELDAAYHMASGVLSPASPLEIELPEGWQTLNMEYSVEMLMLQALSDEELEAGLIPEAEYVDLTETDPDAQTLKVEYNNEIGHTLTLRTGERLPAPGTYRITINWMYEETCFEQTQITFFINYSVDQTMTLTGGAEQ